jgi:hypothetical protein
MAGQLDWIAETPESIAARLEGAKDAQRQTRFTLGVMALLSMTMLILSYNAYQDLAPVLGTISLSVAALWLLLTTRRENLTVASLLQDTDTPRRLEDGACQEDSPPRLDGRGSCSHGQRWLIFHTIAANNLFLTFDRSPRTGTLLLRSAPRWKELPGKIAFDVARDFFFRFPVLASLIVFGLDRWSYFRPDASAGVFLACWIPLLICCHVAASNSRSTDVGLREYGERLRSDLRRRQPRTVTEPVRRRAHAIVETTSKLRLNPH